MPKDRIRESDFKIKLSTLAINDPINPQLSKTFIDMIQGSEQKIEVTYDCGSLMKQGKTYYDKVRVMIEDTIDQSSITFDYLVVCD